MRRRLWLLAATALAAEAGAQAVRTRPGPGPGREPEPEPDRDRVCRGRALTFPRDHGAHPGTRIEWWYLTGWLGTPAAPTHGLQLTFFRSATGLAADSASRFAARHLLFAHAALTDLAAGRHRHVQRAARWSGLPDARPDAAALDDAALHLGPWSLRRDGTHWRAEVAERGLAVTLTAQATQPLLLQGDAGCSRKGPDVSQASRYYSMPQLALAAHGRVDDRGFAGGGHAWLDHEWSDELLHPDAVGWDWIGMNLFTGAALTAFQLRRADGSALWAGGSWRAGPGDAVQDFAPHAPAFTPGRRWRSAATQAAYPLEWQLATPAGRYAVRALLDAQELAGNAGFGAIYWEGLSELLDAQGRRVGLGYLEMTGYAGRLRLG
ncbi:MAG: carotenoid 1,2-hydratase [Pseudomonadota bacterium]